MLSDALPVITSCKKEDANEKRAAGCTGSPLFICGEKRPIVVAWLQSGGKTGLFPCARFSGNFSHGSAYAFRVSPTARVCYTEKKG